MHFSRQLNCWSLRCSWSIACRRCSNYIFILNLTPGFNGLGKDNYKVRRETFKFGDLVHLILETLRYISIWVNLLSGSHFAVTILKGIWLKENLWTLITIWLKLGPKGTTNNKAVFGTVNGLVSNRQYQGPLLSTWINFNPSMDR